MFIDGELWAGKRVLITGHTGFKGAWLSLWLQRLGARVSGISSGCLPPPSLYQLADLAAHMASEQTLDIRDAGAVSRAVRIARPQVVFHLAAQPLVRRALLEPLHTFEVNVIGTANLLEAVRQLEGELEAVVIVTSDKCYEQRQRDSPCAPFSETDRLGGSDPYSASKAAAELLVAAYRDSYLEDRRPFIATARAGNVIGGGDWAQDRLLADAVKVATGAAPAPLMLRRPDAVRPWQHVLNPLSGYLLLAQELMRGRVQGGAWNFGPPIEDAQPVGVVIERLRGLWGGRPSVQHDPGPHPPEADWLALDSSKARAALRWDPPWDLDAALSELVAWHEAHQGGQEMRAVSLTQIGSYTRQLHQRAGGVGVA